MSVTVAELVARLRADTSQYTAAMGAAQAQTRALGTNAKAAATDATAMGAANAGAATRTQRLASALPYVATGAAIVGAAIYKSLDAYSEQERAQLKLENSLKRNPMLAGASAAGFLKQAAALQAVTVASDESIVEAQAMLGTFRMTESQIKSLTPLTVDLARKFDMDLVSASKLVGKAMDGNVSAFKRTGITIDETKFATDRFGAVMEALRNNVGGFAKSEANTAAGKIAQLKNTINELLETVGGAIAPAFGFFADGLKEALGAVNAITGPIGGLTGAVKAYYTAIISPAKFAAEGLNLLIGDSSRENVKKTSQFYEQSAGVFGAFGQQVRASLDGAAASERGHAAAVQESVKALQAKTDAQFAAISADLAAQGSLLGVESAQKAYNDAVAANGPLSLEARTAQNNLQGATLAAAQANRGNMEALVALRNETQGPLRAAIQSYIDDLNRIPRNVRTIINAERQGTILGFGAFTRQFGGPVAAGKPYIVGEKRPELFVPNTAGRIESSVPTGGGGGATTVQISVNAPVGTDYSAAGREIAAALDSHFQRSGGTWRNN